MAQFRFLLITLLVVAFAGIENTFSIPTYPHPIQATQSDRTQHTVRIVADEFHHYILSQKGYTLSGGADGDLHSEHSPITGDSGSERSKISHYSDRIIAISDFGPTIRV